MICREVAYQSAIIDHAHYTALHDITPTSSTEVVQVSSMSYTTPEKTH